MSVVRVKKTSNYTVMSNYHLKDKGLSLKAKGLLSLMLSLPDDWDYTINGLISLCKENETAITSALNELKNLGYLIVNKIYPNKDGIKHIEYEYIVYENPQIANQEVGEQGVENLGVEKQGQLNTNILNTKKENTKTKEVNNVEKENSTQNKIYNIVNYLNKVADTKYRGDSKETIRLIKARLKEGYTEEDFKKVIDNKWADWQNTEWQQYMRPTTLFGNKFENYVNSQVFKHKPTTVDNTIGHFTGNKPITDIELEKLTFEQKKDYIGNMAIKDMTPYQREFFNLYCLARDENGKLLEF